MDRVLLAFEGEKTLDQMEQVFEGTGIQVAGKARSCAETLRLASRLDECVVLCGFKLLAPVRRSDLINSVHMLLHLREDGARLSMPRRSEEEKQIIGEAKALLMERHGMTEAEAHRYIQKRSMDAGAKMVQTAKLILGDSEFRL